MSFFERLFRYFFPKNEIEEFLSRPAPTRAPAVSPAPRVSEEPKDLNLKSFSYEVELVTDTATLVAFDPEALAHRVEPDNEEWWLMDFHELPEVKKGIIVILRTFADGYYKVRVTNQDLTEDEKHFVKFVVPELGVQIVSNQLFLGAGENLPQGYEAITDNGYFFNLKNGDYTVRCYGLDLDDFDDEFTDEETEMAENLPQIVMQILPGKAKIPRLKEEPGVFGDFDAKYVFRAKKSKAAPKRESVEVSEGTGLAGKTVVFTGKLTKFTRKEAEEAAKKQGAAVGSSITQKTDLLVIGEAPGSKATKAREMGIDIISEDQWLELISK